MSKGYLFLLGKDRSTYLYPVEIDCLFILHIMWRAIKPIARLIYLISAALAS